MYGRATTAAVRSFQRSRHLNPSGNVGPSTWNRLIVTLRRGSRGSAVRAVQHNLKYAYGFRFMRVNGFYGHETWLAVLAFQRGSHLRVDGIVGHRTWSPAHRCQPASVAAGWLCACRPVRLAEPATNRGPGPIADGATGGPQRRDRPLGPGPSVRCMTTMSSSGPATDRLLREGLTEPLRCCRSSHRRDCRTAMVQLPAGLKVPRSPSSPVGTLLLRPPHQPRGGCHARRKRAR